nr:hypothetical protein [Massilia sp. PDC64]
MAERKLRHDAVQQPVKAFHSLVVCLGIGHDFSDNPAPSFFAFEGAFSASCGMFALHDNYASSSLSRRSHVNFPSPMALTGGLRTSVFLLLEELLRLAEFFVQTYFSSLSCHGNSLRLRPRP